VEKSALTVFCFQKIKFGVWGAGATFRSNILSIPEAENNGFSRVFTKTLKFPKILCHGKAQFLSDARAMLADGDHLGDIARRKGLAVLYVDK
jgi:hypothetical protein